MRGLILCFALVAGFAHADQWLEAGNQDGGKILLLQAKCSSKKDEAGRLVTTAASTGKSMTGCWYYIADAIHVIWSDGTYYTYSKDIFTLRTNDQ